MYLISGNTVNHHLERSSLDLDWSDVFETDPQMTVFFDMNIGTSTGYADVFARDGVKETFVKIPISPTGSSVWISIRGYYVTGKDTHFQKIIYF